MNKLKKVLESPMYDIKDNMKTDFERLLLSLWFFNTIFRLLSNKMSF